MKRNRLIKIPQVPEVDLSPLEARLEKLANTDDDNIAALITAIKTHLREYKILGDFINETLRDIEEGDTELLKEVVNIMRERRGILESVSKDLIALSRIAGPNVGLGFDTPEEIPLEEDSLLFQSN